MISNTGGTSMTASQLDGLAAELRGYAQQLRSLIPDYAATLQPVLDLDNSQTWSGNYPSQASGEISDWQKSLNSGRETLLSLADSWDTLAQQIQEDAASTPS